MNGPHDMGGMQCFGPVLPEQNEPLFHASWEGKALALTVAMGASGAWNIDQSRSTRESLPPATYLGSSYYEIWIRGLEQLMLSRDLVTQAELTSGQLQTPAKPVARVLQADQVRAALAAGSPSERTMAGAPHFAIGTRVMARNLHPAGHTRLPRYVRGHVGIIERVHGAHVLPDANSQVPADPQADWLYTVSFAAVDLWGADADPTARVSVDAWQRYLEAIA